MFLLSEWQRVCLNQHGSLHFLANLTVLWSWFCNSTSFFSRSSGIVLRVSTNISITVVFMSHCFFCSLWQGSWIFWGVFVFFHFLSVACQNGKNFVSFQHQMEMSFQSFFFLISLIFVSLFQLFLLLFSAYLLEFLVSLFLFSSYILLSFFLSFFLSLCPL